MAKITIENATVERVFNTRNGVGVAAFETFEKRDGTEGKNRYTLWFKQDPGVEEGQVVSASGFLSTRVREYEDRDGNPRTAVDVNVNGARLISGARPVPPAPQMDEPPANDWGSDPWGNGGDF